MQGAQGVVQRWFGAPKGQSMNRRGETTQQCRFGPRNRVQNGFSTTLP